jgi:protein associated with RNAse G/E
MLIHGVTVDSYKFNLELKDIYNEILNLIQTDQLSIIPSVKTSVINREDGEGWMVDYYQSIIHMNDYKNDKESVLYNIADAEQYLQTLKKVDKTDNLFNKFLQIIGF